MSVFFYRYILLENLARYEAAEWEYVGPTYPLGGWVAVIVRRRGRR